jgi:hypothetical protein
MAEGHWGLLGALGIVSAVGLAGGVALFGPNGQFAEMPHNCDANVACVVVASLDGDVFLMPRSGQAMFDYDDNTSGMIANWASVVVGEDHVRRYPRQIDVPRVGSNNAVRVRQEAITRAQKQGKRFGATIVIMGEVRDGAVGLAMIDPNAEEVSWQFHSYEFNATRAPEAFVRDLREALEAAAQSLPISAPAQDAPVAPQPRPRPAPLPAPRNDPVQQSQAAPSEIPRATTVTPLQPRVEPPQPVPPPPPPPPPPPQPPGPVVLSQADFLQFPTRDQIRDVYPERALDRSREGEARVRCTVQSGGRVYCSVLWEEPQGWGFGRAVEQVMEQTVLVRASTRDGRSTVGASFERTVAFQF